MGVSPLVINTLASVAEYREVYPNGVDTRYYLHTSTDKLSAASGVDDITIVTSASERSSVLGNAGDVSYSVSLICIGIGIGLMLSYIFHANNISNHEVVNLSFHSKNLKHYKEYGSVSGSCDDSNL